MERQFIIVIKGYSTTTIARPSDIVRVDNHILTEAEAIQRLEGTSPDVYQAFEVKPVTIAVKKELI